MEIKLTNEMETFYHLKYGFSLNEIKMLWDISNTADELERNMKAAISLGEKLDKIKEVN